MQLLLICSTFYRAIQEAVICKETNLRGERGREVINIGQKEWGSAINYYFLGYFGQKILNPIKSCSPNSIVVKFVQEALVGDNVKGLTKIQDNNICLCLAFKILNKFISCNQKLAFA